MTRLVLVAALLLSSTAFGDAPHSPYRLTWSFPDNALSAIDVDESDLSQSHFASDYELVKYLATMKKSKPVKPKEGEAAAPARELRVVELDGEGKVHATVHYVLPLAIWRKRLGEDMVERMEDEFDAHLRMIFPHGPQAPAAPVDPNDDHSPPPTSDKVKEP